jgi:membrane-associated phospholipid phosphatase
LYALAFCQILAAGIYMLAPLRFPREAFALPADTWSLNRQATAFWHAIDAPVNCLPSLHVTTALLCLWAFNDEPLRPYRAAALLLAALTIASTLTFKQHYVVDLLGGALLAALGWTLFFSRRVQVA